MFFFFFNDTATTEIYTLSLHDALPIYERLEVGELHRHDALRLQHELQPGDDVVQVGHVREHVVADHQVDRKSTRLNSSHANISYAVFCLKKKKNTIHTYYNSTIESQCF